MDKETTDRFWSKVEKDGGAECWLWQAGTLPTGYGIFSIAGKSYRAHRVAWLLARGPIPDGLFVCHTCDVPSCVRPEHLFLGTHDDNMADKIGKGRCSRTRGEDHGRSKLSRDQISEMFERRKRGQLLKEIASAFGVSESLVSMILNRRRWSHLWTS